MRSAILLASAMAVGTIASPLNKRWIFTTTDIEIVTEIVYVYATAPASTSTSIANQYHHHSHLHSSKSKSSPVPAPSSSAVPEPSLVYAPPPSSAPVETSAPVSTSAYTPPPVSTSEYTPPPVSSSVYTPEPVTSSAAPTSSKEASHLSGVIQDTLSSGPDYEAAVLFHHNAARANHGAGPLVWDEACAANALLAAQKCDFTHYIPTDAGQGQNLFTVSGDSFNVTAGITESWYKGEFQVMSDNNLWGVENIPTSIFHEVGHLTQVLWKKTTKVGCVSYDCGDKMTIGGVSSSLNKYTVCNYAEPGNYENEYGANVGLPISYSSLGSWSN